MRARASIFVDSLDAFSHEEVLAVLSGIGIEGQRLDFKEQGISKRRMAYIACGFANAYGGLVAVGIKDPNTTGGAVEESDVTVDISDPALTSIGSTVQSLVYPGLTCELYGYRSLTDAARTLLLMRIPQSRLAPHEYIGKEEKLNLPVRRDREFRGLTLAEIVALQERRRGFPRKSPLGMAQFPPLPISRAITSPKYYFGIKISPDEYSENRLVLTEPEDDAIHKIILMGINCNVMSMRVEADGIRFSNGLLADTSPDAANREAYLQSDGDITLRSEETNSTRVYQIAEILANAYAVSSQAYHVLGLGPRVRAHFEMRVKPDYRPYRGELSFPNEYWDDFSFDMSQDEFAGIAIDTLLRCLRCAGRSLTRDAVRQMFEAVWKREYSGVILGDLRNKWA